MVHFMKNAALAGGALGLLGAEDPGSECARDLVDPWGQDACPRSPHRRLIRAHHSRGLVGGRCSMVPMVRDRHRPHGFGQALHHGLESAEI